jgi:hypothetical protein
MPKFERKPKKVWKHEARQGSRERKAKQETQRTLPVPPSCIARTVPHALSRS